MQDKIRHVLATANFERLQDLALAARASRDQIADPSLSCSIDTSAFAHGFVNVVMEVAFSDNVYWIARLRYQPVRESRVAEHAVDLLSEIATMKTVRDRTSIPVPEVFAFDASPFNPVDYPYIFMEPVVGRNLDNVLALGLLSKHLPKVAKQLADILFQLYGLSFDRLGRPWCGENADEPLQIIPVDDSCPVPQTSLE